MNPEKLIENLRNTDPYIEKIFTNGGCYQFCLFLKTIYPDGIICINEYENHVAILIDWKFYDITGEAQGKFQKMTMEQTRACQKWSFAKNFFLAKECPNCEEEVGYCY